MRKERKHYWLEVALLLGTGIFMIALFAAWVFCHLMVGIC
jgi:hypothetical protein